MTKEAYFEMCEQLGTEPIEEEIPLEIDDFPSLVQNCFIVYQYLTDNWDTMGGNYLGKDYSIVFSLFDVYDVEKSERLLALEFLQRMDSIRSKIVSDKIKQKTPQKK
jgi:hypothetical protein